MQLGLSLGYWGAQPPTDLASTVQEAERLGYDAVWTAEAWGSDAFSPLVYLPPTPSGSGLVPALSRWQLVPLRLPPCTP